MDGTRPPLPPSPAERPAPADGAPDLAAEHREIRASVGRLAATTDLPMLISELTALRALLTRHFAGEERPGGLHDAADPSVPDLLARLQRLFAEHGELLAEADSAHDAAVECWRGPLADVLTRIAHLAAHLARHEADEEEVLQSSVYVELGGEH
jgi:hypothetical protein